MKTKKEASFIVALLPVLALAVILGVGFGVYRFSVEFLLLISALFAGIIAMLYGTTWKEISDAISEKVGKAFMAIFIFVFVGMIIGTWILSGTIPMLIYYGLKLLNPSLFLVSAFIITSIVSICTGTSFGSAGTVGLALIGVAAGLGVNLGAAAGAIISGAYLGDKMSPLSDTTNLAPVAAGCTLFEHVGHMVYTTLPVSVICLIVYFFAGRSSAVVSGVDVSVTLDMMTGLSSSFNFNVLLLLPLAIVLVGSIMGKPPIPVMFFASLTAMVLAMIFQGNTLAETIAASYGGFKVSMINLVDPETLAPGVVTLLERGGMSSMMSTMLKVLCSFAFAGIMTAAGFMNILLAKLRTFAKSNGSLVLVTCIATVVVSIVAGNAYVPILLSGELFKEAFKERGLHAKNLSMILEDAGTVIIPLVPWSAGGAYMASTLGVSTFEYAPWAVLCYTGVIIAIIWGFLGVGLKPIETKKTTAA